MNLLNKEHIDLAWPDIIGKSVCNESKFAIDFFEQKLKNKEQGYALDLGAGDGICHNNVFEFFNEPYCWSGVSVDANPRFFDQRDNLFKDTNVQVYKGAISNVNGLVRFYQDSKNVGHSKVDGKGNIEVESLTVNTFLSKFKIPYLIDFVSMDLEGQEESIIREWDFDKWQVTMFCIEKGYKFKNLMIEKGYNVVNSDGLSYKDYKFCHGNTFFIKN